MLGDCGGLNHCARKRAEMLKYLRRITIKCSRFENFTEIIKNGRRSIIFDTGRIIKFKNWNSFRQLPNIKSHFCFKDKLKCKIRGAACTKRQSATTTPDIQSGPEEYVGRVLTLLLLRTRDNSTGGISMENESTSANDGKLSKSSTAPL